VVEERAITPKGRGSRLSSIDRAAKIVVPMADVTVDSMESFTYERPTTVAAALELMARGEARALAGGTDIIPQLREGRRSARVVVDLKHIAELTAISPTDDGGWRIGAAASIAALGKHTAFADAHPGLLDAARLIGSLQIQSRATLGGNLANGAPSADAVPLLISLGAMADIEGPGGRRRVDVESLLAGPGKTTLTREELLVALVLPARQHTSGARYLRFTPRREMDIAIAGSGVAITLGASGEITSSRITLASVAPTPLRAVAAEARLGGEMPDASLIVDAARLAAEEARPISDTRGSADYRRRLVAVLTRRALEAAITEASDKRGRA
jgi:carbon-monoxide dehydrogenase medium subunit